MKRFFHDRVEYRDDYGRLHRTDGPAVIYTNGDFYYYEFGKQHRSDGPAQIINGKEYYFYNDRYLTEEEFKLNKRTLVINKINNLGHGDT